MPMPPYPLVCHGLDCTQPAVFKIASRWSDGITQELKTYSLSCPHCVARLLTKAQVKQAACRLVPGESLDRPGIYDLDRNKRDRQLTRRCDQETQAAQEMR